MDWLSSATCQPNYLIGFGERLSAATSEARHDPGGEILQVPENLPLRDTPVGKLNQQAVQAAHLTQLLNLFRHMVRRTNQQGAWLQEIPVQPDVVVQLLARVGEHLPPSKRVR